VSRPRPVGLTGAALAVAVATAVVSFPAELDPGARPFAPSEHGPAITARADAAQAGFVERVHDQLARRIPQLDDVERRLLARTIVAEAETARIDPLLVLALIQVESSFDPAARSNRGAAGLMQLREATLRRELERSNLPHGDVHDPVTNVRAGVRYLRRLLDAFGREEVALMAYNAGPNRILGYLREGGIPERFHVYPRRVKAAHRKLRRSLDAAAASPALAQATVAPSDAVPR
jgi:soluble lytic murein transglycosylase-like protein